MKCSQADNLLSAYIDRELSEAERAAVEEHLRGCAGCAGTLHGLKATAALVSALPRRPAPPGFAAEVQRRVEAEAKALAQRGLERPGRFMPLFARCAAAAVLLLAVGFAGYVALRPAEWWGAASNSAGAPPKGGADVNLPARSGGERAALEDEARLRERAKDVEQRWATHGDAGDATGRRDRMTHVAGLAGPVPEGRPAAPSVPAAPGSTAGLTPPAALAPAARPTDERRGALAYSLGYDRDARRQLERVAEEGDGYSAAGAQLAAAPMHVTVAADTLSAGERTVRTILAANGWLVTDAVDPKESLDQPGEGAPSTRVNALVPENQLPGFYKALASREDIQVRQVAIGHERLVSGPEEARDILTRLARARGEGEEVAATVTRGGRMPPDVNRDVARDEEGKGKTFDEERLAHAQAGRLTAALEAVAPPLTPPGTPAEGGQTGLGFGDRPAPSGGPGTASEGLADEESEAAKQEYRTEPEKAGREDHEGLRSEAEPAGPPAAGRKPLETACYDSLGESAGKSEGQAVAGSTAAPERPGEPAAKTRHGLSQKDEIEREALSPERLPERGAALRGIPGPAGRQPLSEAAGEVRGRDSRPAAGPAKPDAAQPRDDRPRMCLSLDVDRERRTGLKRALEAIPPPTDTVTGEKDMGGRTPPEGPVLRALQEGAAPIAEKPAASSTPPAEDRADLPRLPVPEAPRAAPEAPATRPATLLNGDARAVASVLTELFRTSKEGASDPSTGLTTRRSGVRSPVVYHVTILVEPRVRADQPAARE